MNYKLLFLLFAFIATTTISAQIITVTQGNSSESSEADEKVHEIVEQQPEYPGGMEALLEYLGTNIKYPETALAENVKGTVVVRFVVDTVGSISNVTVAKKLHPDCDQEAVRVISQMPKWKPGYQDGKPKMLFFCPSTV